MDNKRGFTSKVGFILSMAAFCIGIGNLWKFPYMVGNNGGGAFLLVYLILVLLVGIPAFLIEVTLGRSARLAPIAAMKKLEGKEKTPWSAIGWLGAIAIFIINSFAIMIVGNWTLGYIVKILNGSLSGLSADEIAETFSTYSADPKGILYGAVYVVLLWLCLNGGIKKGVEKVCSILLPLLLCIMIGLAIYSNMLPGASEGLVWYLKPDFSKINLSVISAAGTQVFFSIGIGMCCGFVYGSYIPSDTSLVSSLSLTAILDTAIAILAGLLCVPALFAFDIEPTIGPSLIFVTLPNLFNQMGSFGRPFGGLFMICVFFAGFTSLVGGSEALVATICDNWGWKRKKACTAVVLAQFVCSIPFTLSYGEGFFARFSALGMGFFDFADFLSSGVCLTVGALLMLLYVLKKWGFEKFKTEVNKNATGRIRLYDWMKPYFCYILPILFVIVCYGIIRTYI
ncbi:MAG: sodium-dependent transporter [Clostridiaceae bacterium]|nr:sodium-dependent transporter [Clostridiaceae bacterium]